MKCKTIHKNLIFYLEGELSANENAKIKLHLAECAECSAFAAEISKSLEILDSEKSPEVNPFFYTRVKARLESQSNKEKVPFWQPIMVKIVQPAFFSLLLIAGIYTGIKIGQPVSKASITIENAESEIIPYLNEMKSEPIEGFLME